MAASLFLLLNDWAPTLKHRQHHKASRFLSRRSTCISLRSSWRARFRRGMVMSDSLRPPSRMMNVSSGHGRTLTKMMNFSSGRGSTLTTQRTLASRLFIILFALRPWSLPVATLFHLNPFSLSSSSISALNFFSLSHRSIRSRSCHPSSRSSLPLSMN
jgi:hypothetical protein